MVERNFFEQVAEIMYDKGYIVIDTGAVNLVGIRTGKMVTNEFDDIFVCMYKLGDGWTGSRMPCTTKAGIYYMEYGPAKGTAILAPGQYLDAYSLGKHKGEYDALVQTGAVDVFRDANGDNKYDYVNKEKGLFGINIHRANSKFASKRVDKWSAGCTVIADPKDFNSVLSLVRTDISLGRSKFTYTLLESSDF